jgi:hypothetical protein
MESTEPHAQLREAERGAAAPYIAYPTTPWWYPFVLGAWAGAMVGMFVFWRQNGALFFAGLAILISLELFFLRWLQRSHGALPMPGKGKPPTEIAAAYRGYFVGLAVIVVAVALVWFFAGVPAAAATTFALVTAGLFWYEKVYATAAARVKARLQ